MILPKGYKSELNLYDTQIAIKTVKDFFQTLLAERLHLFTCIRTSYLLTPLPV